MNESVLSTVDVAKRYGPVIALRSVTMSVSPGEVHALLGANGAGKSTLVKILTGVIEPDNGQIFLQGQPVRFTSPAKARSVGLVSVFQDPALAPDMTIAQNMRLTGTNIEMFRDRMTAFGFSNLDMRAVIRDVPLTTQRLIDLARALTYNPKLLLLDEITAALPSDLANKVFEVMAEVTAEGNSVLFITHRLGEVLEHAKSATILRDGSVVEYVQVKDVNERDIVTAMVGEGVANMDVIPRAFKVDADNTALSVRHLAVGRRLHDVSFDLAKGEVLGVVALDGQGQEELFNGLAGLSKVRNGTIEVNGKQCSFRSPFDAIKRGISLVPSDRQDALLPLQSVAHNLTIPRYNNPKRWGLINASKEGALIADTESQLQIDTRAGDEVRQLSGGNQQKVTIGKWVASGFDTLLTFDPTRGIDARTKQQIYQLLRRLSDEGKSILFFTSELREIKLLADRVIVIYNGRVVAEMSSAEATEQKLLEEMHGMSDDHHGSEASAS